VTNTSRISELSTGDSAPPGPDPGPAAAPGPVAAPGRGPEPARRTEVTADTRLFVPAHPRRAADPEQPAGIGIELQTDAATGELVAAVFTTLDALVDALGESQPWVVLPARVLAAIVREHDVERVSIDPIVHPNTARTWTPERLREMEEAVAS
jgi:type III secretion system (T3SS) SseB-like protein